MIDARTPEITQIIAKKQNLITVSSCLDGMKQPTTFGSKAKVKSFVLQVPRTFLE